MYREGEGERTKRHFQSAKFDGYKGKCRMCVWDIDAIWKETKMHREGRDSIPQNYQERKTAWRGTPSGMKMG